MSFSLGGLTSYVEQQRLPLLTKAVFDAKTQSLMQKRVGVKYEEALNLMDTDAVFQAASTCAWNASGTTTFSQRNISVARVKVQEELCPRSLETAWLASQLTQGSNYEGVPFEQAFATQKAKRIAEGIERAIWQSVPSVAAASASVSGTSGWAVGATSPSGDAQLNRTGGGGLLWLTRYGAGASSVVTAQLGANFSDSTIVSGFETAYNNLPTRVISNNDLVAFCGWDLYRMLVHKLVTVNLYQGDLGQVAGGEMFYPGTNMKVVAVNGLNNTQRIFAGSLSNLFYGTDLLSDEDQFRIWASYDNDSVRFQAAYKYGVQIAFPADISLVLGNNATTPALKTA